MNVRVGWAPAGSFNVQAPTVADVKDLLSPGWREDPMERWGFVDSGILPTHCSLRECSDPSRAGGMCDRHYLRARLAGHV